MRNQRADWIGGVGVNKRLLESNLVLGDNSYLIYVHTHTHTLSLSLCRPPNKRTPHVPPNGTTPITQIVATRSQINISRHEEQHHDTGVLHRPQPFTLRAKTATHRPKVSPPRSPGGKRVLQRPPRRTGQMTWRPRTRMAMMSVAGIRKPATTTE